MMVGCSSGGGEVVMPVVILCSPLIGDIHTLYLHTKLALQIEN